MLQPRELVGLHPTGQSGLSAGAGAKTVNLLVGLPDPARQQAGEFAELDAPLVQPEAAGGTR